LAQADRMAHTGPGGDVLFETVHLRPKIPLAAFDRGLMAASAGAGGALCLKINEAIGWFTTSPSEIVGKSWGL